MNLHEVRVEGLRGPLALACERPRFSWLFLGAPSGFLQTTCRIQVSETPDFEALYWDSGELFEPSSHLVDYLGPPLKAVRTYWVRVQAAGSGQTSAWSDPEPFALALDEWKTGFIAAEPPKSGKSSAVRAVRRGFSVPFRVRSARLWATALGVYQATLNGRAVSDAILTPGWTAYEHRLMFQTYDVASLLKEGDNELNFLVAPGWYKGYLGWTGQRNLYGSQLALSARLLVEGEGQQLVIETDPSWATSATPWSSAELYHGETYDARLESQWEGTTATVVDGPRVVPQQGPLVRPHERFAGIVRKTPSGKTLVDFGQNLSGTVTFRCLGPSGARVVIRHGELLDRHGELYLKNLRSARQTIEYTLRGGAPESFSPRFCTMGFRYAVIDEGAELVDLASIQAVAYYSDMETTAEFVCSDPAVNQLHSNIVWGWKGNSVEVPTDCPQRDERLGWTGDAQVFASTAVRISRSHEFLRKWLTDLRAEQRPDGGVPLVIPDVLSRFRQPKDAPVMGPPHTACGWSDAAVVVPWELYRSSGDRRVLEESFDSMRAWVDRVREISTGGLLWNTWPQLADWLALDAKEGSFFGATPGDLVATAYYSRSVKLVALSAKALGRARLHERYESLHRRIVKAFQAEYFTSTGRMVAHTQTAYALALAWGLVPAKHTVRVADSLVALLEENRGHLTTGFLGTPVLCDALMRAGRTDLAYSLLLKDDFPSWLYQVKKGATSLWEHWDGIKPDGSLWNEKMNSFNHYAYGAVGDWMYRTIGGVAIDDAVPGYRRVLFRPRPGGGITSSRHRILTPYGRVSLEWRLLDSRLELTMEVPPNTTALLDLGAVEAFGSGTFSKEVAWAP